MSEKPNTMHQQAIFDAEQPSGRFQRHSPVFVTARGQADPLPAPNWSKEGAALPTEPPLNVDVNELPDMETFSGLPRETGQ